MKLAFPEAGAALLLPLTLLAVFPAPAGNSPVGLSLAWLACMLLLALPVSFLEFALVRRTRQWPLQGIAQITRDTDVRTTWRAVVPLGLVLVAMLAGLSAGTTADFVPVEPDWLTDAAPWLLLLPALGMAWAGTGRFLGAGGLLAVAAVMTALALGGGSWTPGLPDADGWRYAVLMALLTGGGGLSAWLAMRRTADDGAVSAVLPFWGLQLLSGVLMLMTGDLRHQPAACVYAVPALFAVALMLDVLMQQVMARGRSKPVALGVSAAAAAAVTALAAVPTFLTVAQVVLLLPVLALAVFVGWVMKISHVRKALNLPSEGIYNLWRVAVRLLVPLACLWVIAGRFW